MVLAGIVHMVFIKLPLLRGLEIPIDGGKILGDGKRLFGDNKTWKGFLGMPIGGLIGFGLHASLASHFEAVAKWTVVDFNNLGIFQNYWVLGLVFGLGYILAELPNSYVKRRIDIAPGTNKEGIVGKIFLIIDQIDSVIGCTIVYALVIPMTVADIMALTVIGGIYHYVFAVLLYFVGLKKQMG